MKIRKKQLLTVFTTVFFLCVFIFFTRAQSSQRLMVPEDISSWITSSFSKGKIPPLSFVYDGKASSFFMKRWKYSIQKETSDEPQVVKYCVSYLDPVSGLKLDCHITGFLDFNAVEWVLNFTNTSGKNSATIKQLNVVDFTALSKSEGAFTLYQAKGSDAKRSDFQPLATVLTTGEPVHMQPNGGRSSDDSGFPFFTIESPDHTGIVAAIGWSGNWFSDIEQTNSKAINLKAGMANMKLFLYPGETIRTPGICMLFWQNEDRMVGQNQFRRFLLAHYSRKIDGKFVEYPLSVGFGPTGPSPCNERSCLTSEYAVAMIHRYKQFDLVPEVFWLDAGWYTGCGNWYKNVGNWTADSLRFPEGMKPVSDAAHEIGAKFMLWFEPERVHKNTQFAKEHPEWLLDSPFDEKWRRKDDYLLNLGNPEARKWISKYFGDFIEENGVDLYRQDFNMRPTSYWEANDEPGRTGMTEIRYIEGLYAYWDYLLERFPDLIIDNCASGGRRLDLETISRSAPLWRTDYKYGEPNGYQCHTYGLNFFLPLHGTGCDHLTNDYYFRSGLSSAVIIHFDLNDNSISVSDMQKRITDYKELRPYFYEDYYPLTGLGDLTGDDVWLAYQLNKPSDGSGIVIAFRRKDNTNDSLLIKLKGLNTSTTYSVYNDNDKSVITKTGKELEEGVTLEIDEAPGSLLLKYQKNRNLR